MKTFTTLLIASLFLVSCNLGIGRVGRSCPANDMKAGWYKMAGAKQPYSYSKVRNPGNYNY